MLATPLKRRGFTLIEMLVVIFIIILVSVVALPTVLPAINHRQVSEAARILQGALVGARDKAIHDGQPSGIRLMPDPMWNGINPTTGRLDPAYPLAFNRVVPIGLAPDYQEGMVTAIPPAAYGQSGYVLSGGVSVSISAASVYPRALLACQSARQPGTGVPNAPTSWYWNVRMGDRIQFNNAGAWYTVVGPVGQPNPEGFVNVGPPGGNPLVAVPTITTVIGSGSTATTWTDPVEFLLLVNGQDDNGNGWTDEGFDGVDNDGDGVTDESACNQAPSWGEWEQEAWPGAWGSLPLNVPYTIARRPAPATNAREISLPTQMVIDATTWGSSNPERSRLPIESATGAVDILVNPDGTAYYSSMYGVPSRYGLGAAFLHFWLAERQDVLPIPLQMDSATGQPVQPPVEVPIETIGGVAHYLPVARPGGTDATYAGPTLQGEYALLTLSARSGRVSVVVHQPFDDPLNPLNGTSYDPGLPFREAQQGVSSAP